MVLPGTDLEGGQRLGEEIRGHIERQRFGEPGLEVTASLGVAQYQDGESLRSLIHRADSALYGAKHQGRNMVLTAR